jgi:hypothetical protein
MNKCRLWLRYLSSGVTGLFHLLPVAWATGVRVLGVLWKSSTTTSTTRMLFCRLRSSAYSWTPVSRKLIVLHNSDSQEILINVHVSSKSFLNCSEYSVSPMTFYWQKKRYHDNFLVVNESKMWLWIYIIVIYHSSVKLGNTVTSKTMKIPQTSLNSILKHLGWSHLGYECAMGSKTISLFLE